MINKKKFALFIISIVTIFFVYLVVNQRITYSDSKTYHKISKSEFLKSADWNTKNKHSKYIGTKNPVTSGNVYTLDSSNVNLTVFKDAIYDGNKMNGVVVVTHLLTNDKNHPYEGIDFGVGDVRLFIPLEKPNERGNVNKVMMSSEVTKQQQFLIDENKYCKANNLKNRDLFVNSISKEKFDVEKYLVSNNALQAFIAGVEYTGYYKDFSFDNFYTQ